LRLLKLRTLAGGVKGVLGAVEIASGRNGGISMVGIDRVEGGIFSGSGSGSGSGKESCLVENGWRVSLLCWKDMK
jgi:hypothetical protein